MFIFAVAGLFCFGFGFLNHSLPCEISYVGGLASGLPLVFCRMQLLGVLVYLFLQGQLSDCCRLVNCEPVCKQQVHSTVALQESFMYETSSRPCLAVTFLESSF